MPVQTKWTPCVSPAHCAINSAVLTRKQPQLFHVCSLPHAYNWAYQCCAYWRWKTVLTPPPPLLPTSQ
jgi:hypothetical protein